jgi:hypothetical protein
MADIFGAAEDLLGGLGGFLGGQSAAKGAKQAAKFYAQAAQYTQLETGIKEVAANRAIYQTLGGARADIAASGLKLSGSAADLMRSSAAQGGLTRALIALQGKIEVSSYQAQASAASEQASASSTGGFLSGLGGIIGAVGAIFSDDNLKEDVMLISRRYDGMGYYRFRYKGTEQVFEGVLASEVERIMPEAIWYDDLGSRRVDYDRVRMPFRSVN